MSGKCPGCLEYRGLQKNGNCGLCNNKRGIRCCRRCLEFYPVPLSFTQYLTVCDHCGKRRGRKAGKTGGQDTLILELRGQGLGIRFLARTLKIDPATVRRALRRVTPE